MPLRFARFLPEPMLADVLDHVWLLQGEGDGEVQPVLPDGCPELVFQLGDPFEQRQPDGRWHVQGRRLLVGQQLHRVELRPGPRVHCLGLHLRPAGLAAFIAGDLRRYTGQIVELDLALGCSLVALAHELAALPEAAAVIRLQQALQACRRQSADLGLQQAAEALEAGLPLPAVAAGLGQSERQLRRRFETAVGLSPKRFARLRRFQQVFALGREQDAGAWAEAALAGGYCDQAHFNRDFRAFTGSRPRELLRDLQPLTAFFLSETSKTAAAGRG
jgi:AraC-like DNA-binding protein